MKTHLKWWLLLLTGIGLVLSFFYVRTQAVDEKQHQLILSKLERLSDLDNLLDRDVLQSRFGLLNHYDPLVDRMREMRMLLHDLSGMPLNADPAQSREIRHLLNTYAVYIDEKEALIDQFKAENAMLKNSISFLPLAVERLDANPVISAPATILLRDILLYNRSGEPSRRQQLLQEIQALSGLEQASGIGHQTDLATVLAHARQVLVANDKINHILEHLLQTDSVDLISPLRQQYQAAYASRLRYADVNRLYFYLVIFSVLHLAYTASVLTRLRKNARLLAEEKELAQVTLESIADAVISTDIQGRVHYLNPVAETLTGWSVAEAQHLPLQEVFQLRDERSGEVMHLKIEKNGCMEAAACQRVLLTREGEMHPVEISTSPIRNVAGRVFGVVVVFRSIETMRKAQDALKEREQYLQAVLDNISESIVAIDEQGKILSFNPATPRLFGYDGHDLQDRNIEMLMPEELRIAHAAGMRRYLSTGHKRVVDAGTVELEGLCKDGTVFPMEVAISEIRIQNKRLFIGILRDITERKESEQQLAYRANYDALTGLPNRTLFMDRLSHALVQAHRQETLVALMFLDLDGFKAVNDTFGHATGDILLQQVAQRLQDCLRDGDTVARLGGDEFTVILEGLRQSGDATTVAEKMLEVLSWPFYLAEQEIQCGVSIGIAFYPEHDEGGDSLLRRADAAMYQAKSQGRRGICLYTPALQREA